MAKGIGRCLALFVHRHQPRRCHVGLRWNWIFGRPLVGHLAYVPDCGKCGWYDLLFHTAFSPNKGNDDEGRQEKSHRKKGIGLG